LTRPASPCPTQEIESELELLFGESVDWRRESGVLHVTAIAARGREPIAVGPAAPRSRTDRFVLGFARARADLIVTTGAILRAEPELVHRTSEDPRDEAAWRHWRADRLGRSSSPQLLVLTASGEIPLDHPAVRSSPHTIVWTTRIGRARLGAARARVEVLVGGDPPEAGEASPMSALAAAIGELRGRSGIETIVLEAGPRSTQGLYETGASVDELLLSVFMGGSFPAVAGPELPATECLAAHFGAAAPRTRVRVEEESGGWIFERYRRT
jgi:riboflavin biosynthesis pyrimidine reductase